MAVLATSMYLYEEEARVLASLPARVLLKSRRTVRFGGFEGALDIFEGALEGLVLFEVGFASAEALAGFTPPAFLGREVTRDDRFSGGGLAGCAFRDLEPSTLFVGR